MTTPYLPPVIIGAGPAGLACAQVLVAAGLRPIVIEETPRPGGQGTRRLTPALANEAPRFMGASAARRYAEREAQEDRVLAACDWRPSTLAWAIYEGTIQLLHNGAASRLDYDQLMVATGATDRIMALPGWTLPGVFSLGGAQVALKQHGAFIGKKVVLAGASPLLYLAAVQYLRMGHEDITIIDTAQPSGKRSAALGMMLSAPATMLEGLGLLVELRMARRRVRRIEGARLLRVLGEDRVAGVEICHPDQRVETIACDAVGYGHGLRPETQLAELAGASFAFDEALRNWFPVVDETGRAAKNLWLAGDSTMTGGRVAAARSGQLAALSMLAARGVAPPVGLSQAKLVRSVARLRKFQKVMAKAFPWPHETASTLPDETVVCRCERITAGEIRSAIRKDVAPVEVNRVKAITRCGMGRCQGRYCGQTLQELTAATANLPVREVGRLRAQAPVRPIPMRAALQTEGADE